jgi:hypothetical protein
MYHSRNILPVFQWRWSRHELLKRGPRRLQDGRDSHVPSYNKGATGGFNGAKLLCHVLTSVHAEIIDTLMFFDSIQRTISGGQYATMHWAIYLIEKHATWTTDTLVKWLHEITTTRYSCIPNIIQMNFIHSVRKGAATSAYYIIIVTL